jgi:hypothetical protein
VLNSWSISANHHWPIIVLFFKIYTFHPPYFYFLKFEGINYVMNVEFTCKIKVGVEKVKTVTEITFHLNKLNSKFTDSWEETHLNMMHYIKIPPYHCKVAVLFSRRNICVWYMIFPFVQLKRA